MRRIVVALAVARWRVTAASCVTAVTRLPCGGAAALQQWHVQRRWQHTAAACPAEAIAHDAQQATGDVDRSDSIDHDNDVAITDAQGNRVEVESVTQFSELRGVPAWLQEGIASLGYPSMMGIQRYTFPVLTRGHDVVGLAPTGSGKTVAFAVPALMSVAQQQQQQKQQQSSSSSSSAPRDDTTTTKTTAAAHAASRGSNAPMVLVLAPTRELVQQTSDVFTRLARGQARIAEAYGGAPRDAQARKLHSGCDVFVACPGRLKDFLDAGDVRLDALSFLVFDEADRLLDMGFQNQLDDIMTYVPVNARVQKMMWSATWPPAVRKLAYGYLAPQWRLIRVGAAGTGAQLNAHIAQTILFAPRLEDRVSKLAELIERGDIDDTRDKLILFVERQSDTDDAAWALSRRLRIDVNCIGVLHGGMQQQRRDVVMQRFKRNQTRILIATDVASRGLDIPDITCVVNLQAPRSIDSYCHRIGRTGRAGRSGVAYTFVGPENASLAAELIDYLQRCKMDVPHELHELAASHTVVAPSRRDGRRNRRPRRDRERRDYARNSNDIDSDSLLASW